MSACPQSIAHLLMHPSQILVDGHDIAALDSKWYRAHVAVVSQSPVLFSLTIAQNIQCGRPDASYAEVVAAARAANCAEFVDAMPDG